MSAEPSTSVEVEARRVRAELLVRTAQWMRLQAYEEQARALIEDGHGDLGRPILELVGQVRELEQELVLLKAAERMTPEAVAVLRELLKRFGDRT